MPFRDELEAALSQVETLRTENARLRANVAPRPARPRARALPRLGAAACVLLLLALLFAARSRAAHVADHAAWRAPAGPLRRPLESATTPRGWLWIVLPSDPGPQPLAIRIDGEPADLVWTDAWDRAWTASLEAEAFFRPRCVRVPTAVFYAAHHLQYEATPAAPAAMIRCGPYRAESPHELDVRSAAGATLLHTQDEASDAYDTRAWNACRARDPSGC